MEPGEAHIIVIWLSSLWSLMQSLKAQVPTSTQQRTHSYMQNHAENHGHQLFSGKWKEEGIVLFMYVTFYFLNTSEENNQIKKEIIGKRRGKLESL